MDGAHELHARVSTNRDHSAAPSGVSKSSNGPNNARAFIDNPFNDIDPTDLRQLVRDFVKENELDDHLDAFEKAALLARDPGAITGSEFTDAQRHVIAPNGGQSEDVQIRSFWQFAKALRKEPKQLQVIIVACALAAAVQGWDQASINGANLRWPADLKWRNGETMVVGLDEKHARERWFFGFVNAAPFLFASLVGTWFSDPLNEYLYGRRPSIFASAAFCLISVIGSACVRTVPELLACRILLGIGIGSKASVVPVYAAEVAPTYMRGSLVMCWQLFVALGIFLGYSANLAVFNIRDLNWRLQLASASLPAISLLIIIFVCPESPRFLIKKHRPKKAFESLRAITKHDIIAAKELLVIQAQLGAEARLLSKRRASRGPPSTGMFGEEANLYVAQNATSYWRRAGHLITIPRIARATLAAFVVMISQQLCGVNVISFYSATIFSGDVKYQNIDNWTETTRYAAWSRGLWISWGTGLANFLFAIPAFGVIDRRGRRPLLLWTIPGLIVTLLAAAFSFLIKDDKARDPVVAVILVMYMAFYSPGLGPVPFTYSAEVFPLITREVGMSFSVFVNLFGAGVLSLVVPVLNDKIGSLGLLCLFAGLNVIAFLMIYSLVYETKQVSLEKLNLTFDVSVGRHFAYQMDGLWRDIQRVFLKRDIEELPPLRFWSKRTS